LAKERFIALSLIVGEPHLLLMLVFVAVLDRSPQCSFHRHRLIIDWPIEHVRKSE